MIKDKHYRLYGAVEFEPIPPHFVDERLRALNNRLTILLGENWWSRDAENVNEILKAIAFWEEFKELYCA